MYHQLSFKQVFVNSLSAVKFSAYLKRLYKIQDAKKFPLPLGILLCSLLFLTACGKNMSTKKFLALGDSYTIGESVERHNSWPFQLQKKIKPQVNFDVKIIAKTGWTTDELAAAIRQEKISETFDMVSLLIGVNNQYRRRSADEYRKEFIELLEQAIVFAGNDPSKVVVVSIPDWGVTPFAEKDPRSSVEIGKQIDLYNKINAEESLKKKCYYVDITPISKKASVDSELNADDGLHPSAKMYGMWVEKISPVALKILK